jgi:WD40 repeat protein
VRSWKVGASDIGRLMWEKVGLKQNVDRIAFSPDGSAIATTFTQILLGDPTQNGQRTADVKLWDAKTLTFLKTTPDSSMDIYDIAFAPDGRSLAVSTFGDAPPPDYTQGRIRIWDTNTGKISRTVIGKDLGRYYCHLRRMAALSPQMTVQK